MSTAGLPPQNPPPPAPANRPRPTGYVPALGPGLKRLFWVVLALVSLLAANSVYLGTVTLRGWLAGPGVSYENYFYLWMFLLHLGLGLALIVPFLAFGTIHLVTARNRRNRRAVRVGYALFIAGIAVLLTGLLLMRVGDVNLLRQESSRRLVYWLHIGAPVAAGWLYWLHRLAGPRIRWRYGAAYAVVVGGLVAAMIGLQNADPRKLNAKGSPEGRQYFEPSLAVTANAGFIPAETLMMDEYCLKCHADAYAQHQHSAHRISSFNNPMYFASVNETRDYCLKRDGNVKASRWCAGCHDPVPFFSGQFDDPNYDIVGHPTARAAITCTVCHAISSLNETPWNDQFSTRGNADYTIEEPIHYPFAFSENSALQWINNQLVKAKPSFHKQTFLKPLHKSAEFCASCHKVHLPYALNHYREFLRGQDHYGSFLLSGVSGGNARAFYYPEKTRENCTECHMPLVESGDFAARNFDGSGQLKVHNHLFPAANTALPYLRGDAETVKTHQDFLKGVVRVDLFGLREEGRIDGQLRAPLRPELPPLKPGGKYLLETVLRTLKVGHLFSQGTVDSNEIWVDVEVRSGERVIGRSGGIDDTGTVDPWSHFINVFMLDREGNRIDRRNPQDIFTPLYNKQIPPGGAQIVHFGLELPAELTAPVTITAKLQYRKFDARYMNYVGRNLKPGGPTLPNHTPGEDWHNTLPISTIASDTITLPVEGLDMPVPEQQSAIAEKDRWQRWNDYGIGLLLEGAAPGSAGGKAELLQAEQAFLEVERLGRFDGPVNLARVYLVEGRIDEAVDALERAGRHTTPPAPPWTLAWFNGVVNKQQGYLERAAENFRGVLEDQTAERRQRGLRFERDFVVRNELAQTLFELGKQEREDDTRRSELLRESVRQFEQVLFYDSEDVMAHYNLGLLYAELGETEKSELHRRLHQRYKPDDNAQELAVNAARRKYPAANVASEPLVIYPLNRPGAPGLPGVEQAATPLRAEPLDPATIPTAPRGEEPTPDPAGE